MLGRDVSECLWQERGVGEEEEGGGEGEEGGEG